MDIDETIGGVILGLILAGVAALFAVFKARRATVVVPDPASALELARWRVDDAQIDAIIDEADARAAVHEAVDEITDPDARTAARAAAAAKRRDRT